MVTVSIVLHLDVGKIHRTDVILDNATVFVGECGPHQILSECSADDGTM